MLSRNKLWLYNEQMTLDDKPKPFAKTYAKWVEFTDGMAQQVWPGMAQKLWHGMVWHSRHGMQYLSAVYTSVDTRH